jgi:hypothetical protein
MHEDEWDFSEEEHPPEPPKVKKSPPGGGGTSMKDYLVVALIAIIAVMGINNYIFARTAPPTGAAGGGGCCGGGGSGTAGLTTADLQQIGLDYYVQATGEENLDNVEARVEDFGCHQEIHIYKDGQLVMKVGYASGQAYEL